MLFLITWLFFGGYKYFIPTKAVAKVLKWGSVNASDEKRGGSEGTGGQIMQPERRTKRGINI